MGGQVLGAAEGVDPGGDVGQRVAVALDHVDDLEVGVDRQAAGVPGGAAGGQHVVGAGQVVAERDRAVGADEDRAGVADLGRDLGRVLGLDLQVLGRPGVGDGAGRRGCRRRGRSRPGCRARCSTRSRCLVAGSWRASSSSTRAGRPGSVVISRQAASSSCSAWPIRSAATKAGSAVWSAMMAISVGPFSPSMPTTPGQDALGGGDVDVAGAGDHVDRGALVGAVGEHRQRLGAADRVHLGDAEQRAGGEDGRVRQAAELLLRRGRDRDLGSTPAAWAGTTFMTTDDG